MDDGGDGPGTVDLPGGTDPGSWSPRLIPRLPASAGAVLRDRAGRLLVLRPTYKAGWTIPGGQMEDSGETPWEACRRETLEETGLVLRHGRLLAVDFLRPRQDRPGGIRFLFDGGSVDEADKAGIRLPPEELSEHRFVELPQGLELLSGPLRRRLEQALDATTVRYLEQGRPVPGVSD